MMIQSALPRKQRKFRYNAPLHVRQKWVHVHLSKDLRAKNKKRNIGVRKGDTVKVMRGKFKGKSGKVIHVRLDHPFVHVEGVVLKKQTGKEVPVNMDPSNLLITTLIDRKK